jgi:hypothetical protein
LYIEATKEVYTKFVPRPISAADYQPITTLLQVLEKVFFIPALVVIASSLRRNHFIRIAKGSSALKWPDA